MTSVRQFSRDADRRMLAAARDYAQASERAAKRNVSGFVLNVKTGRLYNSIRGFVESNLGTGKIRVGLESNIPGKDYNKIWEETGTKRHFVAPVRAKALSWTVGGRRFFSMGHWIPAVPKKPYLAPALKTGQAKYQRNIASGWRAALDRFFTRVIRIVSR